MRNGDLTGHGLGEYILRELLGRGAVGSVYRAYQPSLNRHVAIKVLTPTPDESPAALAERFALEARTFASLEHPHIIPIYDYGTDYGLSYIVMRLLTGGTLEERLQYRLANGKPPPSPGEVAHLLTQIADALAYAHERAVIHRDVKAGNVMFDERGRAYLVDFSIVKLLDGRQNLTADGLIIGTPALMAPEQWRGEPLTPAADQYALGAVIYELLTGKLPLQAPTTPALMYRHLNDIPIPVHELCPELPEAVSRVLAWSLAKDSSERYPNVRLFAQAFAESVRDAEGGSTGFFTFPLPSPMLDETPPMPAPVFATRQVTPPPMRVEPVPTLITSFPAPPPLDMYPGLYPSEKIARSERPFWVSALVGVGIGLLAVSLCLGAMLLGAAALLEPGGALPTSVVEMAVTTPSFFTEPTIDTTMPPTAPPTKTSMDADSTPTPPTMEVEPIAPRGGQGADAPVLAVSVAPEVAAVPTAVPQQLWQVGRVIPSVDTSVRAVTFMGGGSQILYGGNSDSVQRAYLAEGESRGVLYLHSDTVYTVEAGGNRIASGDAGGTIRLWEHGQITATLAAHTGAVRQVVFSPDSRLLASVGEDGSVRLWDAARGSARGTFSVPNRVLTAAFSPDGRTLATGGTGMEIALWDIATQTRRGTLSGHTGEVRTLAYSPDGALLASGSSDGTVRLWDTASGSEMRVLRGHNRDVFTVQFSPDGALVASGGADNLVLLWDTASGERVVELTGHGGWVFDVAFAPDGRTIVSAGGDGTVRIWHLTL